MMGSAVDGEERVVATAQHILKSLGSSKDFTSDMLSILSTLDHNRFASSPSFSSSSAFDDAEAVILSGEDAGSSGSFPWEDDPSSVNQYLSAVDHMIDVCLSSSQSSASPERLDRAESLLQIAMSRLEDEVRAILLRNAALLDADCLCRRIPGAGSGGEEEERECSSDPAVDLLPPEAVDCLQGISDRMLRAGYEKECFQAYVGARREALDEFLSTVGVERLSIEEVQKIEWRDLDDRMKKWSQSIKIAIRFLFPGERRLIGEIFRADSQIAAVCFVETVKCSLMTLLNFAEAVSIGRPSSEKLFRLLDMYEALSSAMTDLQSLFSGTDYGEFICSETKSILLTLAEVVKATLSEFEAAVKQEASQKAVHGGEIHPLTRYVMNYIQLIADYRKSLNSLLGQCTSSVSGEVAPLGNHSPDSNSSNLPRNDGQEPVLGDITPVGRLLLSVISNLETKLSEKSKLYEDVGLQYVFLMNNILYIVQKIKDSELFLIFGDQWVRKRRGLIRQYATSYLRASWTGVLSCLKDEGLGCSGSLKNASKTVIKERFKKFNLVLEELYRNQTGWKVSDPQLREELRLSVSEKVIPAYRSFMGRFGVHLETGRSVGKYIKYSPEDMENLLLDLFEGMTGSLNHSRRKLST